MENYLYLNIIKLVLKRSLQYHHRVFNYKYAWKLKKLIRFN